GDVMFSRSQQGQGQVSEEDMVGSLRHEMASLRRRVRLANAIAASALALVVVGGTAWAASEYLITSTSQIKPGVLADIERAAQGPKGARGSTGTQGAPGADGPTGPAGAV